ncbi:kinase-like domain-containing protein [Lyophyllum atratum]|nr:kinase-like domain-containing protein [Lyophyllum atratum]
MLRRVLRLTASPRYPLPLSTLSSASRRISSRIDTPKFSDEEKRSFYEYTSGRWLWNESQQLSARHVEFNVDAIQRIACQAFGAASCASFSKLDEGSYNKVFLLRFDDDREAIVRIPCPLAGPPFLATASEVATMEFARDVLKIPTPRVLAWSGTANASVNPVGAEYIIMEKAPGIDLRTRWPLVTVGSDALAFVNDFVDMERKFERVSFSQIGSLYFKEDVPSGLRDRPLFSPDVDLDGDETIKAAAEKYRIGPMSDRQWWRGGRAELDIDRGPWFEPLSYFIAAVRCELTYIESPDASAAQFRQNPFVPLSLYKRILRMCEKMFPLILPPAELCAPTLWHPDLSEANIRVAAESGASITSVIDWQYAKVAPYFTQALFPSMLLYDGDVLPVPSGLRLPKLPADLDTYPPDKQVHIRSHHRLIMRQKAYEIFHAERGYWSTEGSQQAFARRGGDDATLVHPQVLESWPPSHHERPRRHR